MKKYLCIVIMLLSSSSFGETKKCREKTKVIINKRIQKLNFTLHPDELAVDVIDGWGKDNKIQFFIGSEEETFSIGNGGTMYNSEPSKSQNGINLSSRDLSLLEEVAEEIRELKEKCISAGKNINVNFSTIPNEKEWDAKGWCDYEIMINEVPRYFSCQ